MNEILNMLNALTADELDSVLMRGRIMLEKKRKDEAEAIQRQQERLRQEKIEQERKRQEEIAALQRKLQELQNQRVTIPDAPGVVKGDQFVMYDKPAQPKPAQPAQISCPYCRVLNRAGSVYCSNCGQKMTVKPPVAPPPQPAAPVRATTAQVRYADESMKTWDKLPDEYTLRVKHEIQLLQPNGGKYAYYMEVTNRRILITRESSGAKNAALAARMGGGLLGSLIAEGVKSASGSGPKPWLEIPLAAISNCGLHDKKDFFIVADQTYVLKNHGYEKLLPDLIAKR